MSSFVTNAGTRRGKRSRYGTTTQNTQSSLASHTDSTINTHIYKADTIQPKLRPAVIGNEQSNGLTIQGTHEFSRTGASNPDDRTIPLGTSGERSDGAREDHLNRPEFPINLNARGILTFPDPIKIKAIEGDVSIKGNLAITGEVTSVSSIPISFISTLQDTVGGFVTQTTSTGIQTPVNNNMAHLYININWSASGMGAAQAVQISGLPALKEGIFTLHGLAGIAVTKIGAHIVGVVDTDGNTTMELYQVDNTTHGPLIAVLGADVSAPGQMIVDAMVRLH